MKFIAENKKYKIYSLYESVYLKDKGLLNDPNIYSEEDEFICWHYDDPNDGIITENYVIVSGYGILIYDLKNKTDKHLFDDVKDGLWTNGIYQDELDDYHTEFRFVSYNSDDKIRVFKMNIIREELVELD